MKIIVARRFPFRNDICFLVFFLFFCDTIVMQKKKKYPIKKGLIWDYKIPKNWQPKTDADWRLYLERKVNYDDWEGIPREKLLEYLPFLQLDPGKRIMMTNFFDAHGTHKTPTKGA